MTLEAGDRAGVGRAEEAGAGGEARVEKGAGAWKLTGGWTLNEYE